jgi:hypothetical protein
VDEIEKRLKRLNMISKERGEVLKDLKEKVRFILFIFPCSALTLQLSFI